MGSIGGLSRGDAAGAITRTSWPGIRLGVAAAHRGVCARATGASRPAPRYCVNRECGSEACDDGRAVVGDVVRLVSAGGGDAVREELLRLEVALARRDPRGIEGDLGSLIADDFQEFGASGRVWTAEATREMVAAEALGDLAIDQFMVAELAAGVVLATYRTGPPRPANRASIWVWRDGRWRMRFHQGTPVEQPGP